MCMKTKFIILKTALLAVIMISVGLNLSSQTYTEVFKYDGSAIGSGNAYEAKSGSYTNNNITMNISASIGAVQSASAFWFGTNSNETTISNSTLTNYPEIAAALNLSTEKTRVAALIFEGNLSDIERITYSQSAGQLSTQIAVVYSTDNGTSYQPVCVSGCDDTPVYWKDLNAYTSDFEFTFTAVANARYAVVINKTTELGFIQSRTPVVTFYKIAHPYTVTFNPGSGSTETSSLTETSGNAGVILPVATPPSICVTDGWIFAGWAEASVSETTTKPVIYQAGDVYYPSENTNLYAVYGKTVIETTTYHTNPVCVSYSSDATISSPYYIVDNGGNTITGIPYNTPLSIFKSRFTPAEGASFEIYESDGVTIAASLATGYKLIVTAEDGITKKVYTITLLQAPTGDIIISEYIEGSANNKAIEIYNASGAYLDLSPYSIKQAVNGGDWGMYNDIEDIRYSLPLSGIMAPGQVMVYANSEASQEIRDIANIWLYYEGSVTESTVPGCNVVAFDGDDAIGLFKDNILIDVIGIQGEQPEAGWDIAGITAATQNHTLVRKGVTGSTDWEASAGTNEINSGWIVYDQDDVTHLGAHSISRMLYVSPESLNFGNEEINTSSDAGTITINSSNLDENITYRVTEGYETIFTVAENSWDAATGGTLNVVFTPAAEQDYNAVLTISSNGAVSKTVALSGTGIVIYSSDVTISSLVYDVDYERRTIMGVPYNTSQEAFKSNIIPPVGGSFVVLDNYGQPTDGLITGYMVLATAEDGVTDRAYTIFMGRVAPDGDLVISEYIEGSESNKALEIYNGTGVALDLTPYKIEISVNGTGWGIPDIRFSLPLKGIIKPGEVLVCANADADQEILDVADILLTYESSLEQNSIPGSNVLSFNGNDAIGLFNNNTLIDIIGLETPAPEYGWEVAGVEDATMNHTLVRKDIIGNTDWTVSAGTNEVNSEWIIYPQDEFNNLGSHSISRILYVSPSSLLFGDVYVGENSTSGTVTINSSNLAGDISYEVTEGFESIFAVTENTWDAATGGTLAVVFTPAAEQTYNATLTIKSREAEDKTVILSGTGIAPAITISSPIEGSEITTQNVTVLFLVENFETGADAGKVKYTVNGGEPEYTTENSIELTELNCGSNTVVLELVNNDNTSLDPVVTTSVGFTYSYMTTPVFDQLGPYCVEETPDVLPLISTDGMSGIWSPSEILTAESGTATYTFTPAAGQCAEETTMDIVVNLPTTPTFDQLGPYCVGGAPEELLLTSNNEITGIWSPSEISTTESGTATYTFTPAAGQCAEETTMDIVVNLPTTPTFDKLGPYCVGETPDLLPIISNNDIPGTWSPSEISTTDSGTATYTFTPAVGQCAEETTMDIVVNLPATPTFDELGPYCVGETPDLLPIISNNDIPGIWSPAEISTTGSGTVTYTFTPDAGQCAMETTINITVNPNPVAEITTDSDDNVLGCNDIIRLTATGGVSYEWNTQDYGDFIDVTSAGTYSVIVTDANGCTAESEIEITVDFDVPVAQITKTPDTNVLDCNNSEIKLTVITDGETYLWNDGTTGTYIDINVPGAYTVTVTGSNNCSVVINEIITQDIIQPNLVITNDPDVNTLNCDIKLINLTVSGALTYEWGNGSTDDNINVTEAGTYSVTATAINGCTNETSVTIYADLTPELTVTSPSDGAVVREDYVNVEFSICNFELGTETGKVAYKLGEAGTVEYITESPVTITGLSEGLNIIYFELVDENNDPLDPAVIQTLDITYEILPLLIAVDEEGIPVESISFGTITEGSTSAGHVISISGIGLTGGINYLKSREIPADGFIIVEGEDWDESEGGDLILTFSPPSSGEYTATLTINSNGAEDIMISLSGTGSQSTSPVLTVDPAILTFEEIVIGESSASQTLTISGSDLNGDITYELTEGYESIFVVTESEWNASTGGTLSIVFTPSELEDYSAVLTINSEGADSKTVALSGTGIEVSSNPAITITSPEEGEIIYSQTVDIVFTVTDFVIGVDSGKVKYTLNTETPQYVSEVTPIVLTELEVNNTVELELVNNDQTSLNPPVKAIVNFEIRGIGIDTNFEESVRIYPNPVTDYINIELTESVDRITLINVLGQKIIEMQPASLAERINIENLEPGTYFINVIKSSISESYKIIVK